MGKEYIDSVNALVTGMKHSLTEASAARTWLISWKNMLTCRRNLTYSF
jgi:hypothetical protein